MRRKPRRASKVSHDRWLVSYADFVTLLFAFFVMMYSTSQVDKRKVGKLAVAIQAAFQELGVFPASTSKIPANNDGPMPFDPTQGMENKQRAAALGRIVSPPEEVLAAIQENGNLNLLRQDLEHALAAEISRREVALRRTPDGLVISLQEIGFFDSGSSALKSHSLPAFGRIAGLLSPLPYRVRVEGHTDDIPIHNARFASNWELSAARATELVRLLITTYGFPPQRLSGAGYAQYHPVASNATPEGRTSNRRVDIVVLGK